MNDRKDRVRVHIGGQEFNVVGGAFQEMLAAIKQISGRRFVSELKVWQLPGTVEDIQRQLDISGYWLEGGAPLATKTAPPQPQPSSLSGDRVRVLVGGYRLAVVGGNFQDMLALVKSLPNRRFDSETKLWEISGDPGTIKGMVEAAGFQLEGAATLPFDPVPPMASPDFGPSSRSPVPPPFEAPDFLSEDDITEPPDWLLDQLARPPDDEAEFFDEPPFFDLEPPSFVPKPAGSIPMVAPTSKPAGDRVRLRLGEMLLVVTGGSFQEMLSLIKNIPGRRFEAEERVWEIPDSMSLESLGQRVAAAGFVLEQE
jgi:hypothetical protein